MMCESMKMMSDTVWQYKPDRPTDTPTGLLLLQILQPEAQNFY